MTKINKRIDSLEDRIFDKFKWGSTTITPECLTENERQLFDQIQTIVRTSPKKLEQIPEHNRAIDKIIYYKIRRGVDFFMKMMDVQLHGEEKYVFWLRFVDFVSETMFIISRNRGSDIIAKIILGENLDDWPDDNDPKWKELEQADEKWNKDFNELWDYTSPTMEKIFSCIRNQSKEMAPTKEEFENGEQASTKTDIHSFFGKLICLALSCPSELDMIPLVALSLSNKEKTLMEMLAEQKLGNKNS